MIDVKIAITTTITLFNGGNSVDHPQCVMINDANAIMVRTGTMLNHTYREASQCADHLVRIGAEQNEDLVVSVDQQPLSIREFFSRDSLNLRQLLDLLRFPFVGL